MAQTDLKPVKWIGSSRKDLKQFSSEVQAEIGYALFSAQQNLTHPSVKPLKGFKGINVLEIIEDFDGDTYRAIYTIKFKGVVYVLHAFQKKSKKGIATPKKEIDLIIERLKLAEEDYRKNYS